MEHNSWKILIADKALFFNKDKQRYCLIAPRYFSFVLQNCPALLTTILSNSSDNTLPRSNI
uniref:Uncharacterized protein n=1 Tax=Arundo donax TaxID=35708 RepID=A0A0A9EPV7_ARUDO